MFVLLLWLSSVSATSSFLGIPMIEDQYIGCYRTSLQSSDDVVTSVNMAIDVCTTLCRQLKRTYASLQNGSDCRCSDEIRNQHPMDDCHVICPGNAQQYCGGSTASVSIYSACPIGEYGDACSLMCNCLNRAPCDLKTGFCANGCEAEWTGSSCNQTTRNNTRTTVSAISSMYIGCYADNHPKSRDFESENYKFQATVETCSSFCRKKGYTYFGLQYSTECFCGNSFGQFGRKPEVECNHQCTANKSQICGGVNRNSVFSVCPIGSFGDDCVESCHCADNNRCFSSNGTCMSANCADGWKGKACNIKDYKNCTSGFTCLEHETCRMLDLKFAQVPRCECDPGYLRGSSWGDCVEMKKCRNDKECNSLHLDASVNQNLDGVQSSQLVQAETSIEKESRIPNDFLSHNDSDTGGKNEARLSLIIPLIISILVNIVLLAFLLRSRINRIWNPYTRYHEDADVNSI